MNIADNWATVLSRAIRIFEDRENYCYLYGAKGQVLTPKLIKEFFEMEPAYFSQYTPEQKKDIIDYSTGKVGIDCSGFIDLCTGMTNWSTGYYEDSVNKTDPISGTWGNILYTTHGGKGRHIGIDVGQGRFLHSPKELRSIELGIIRLYDWEASGQIKGISYHLAGNK